MSSKKLTVLDFIKMKQRGEKISMLTAYDYSMASLLDSAGFVNPTQFGLDEDFEDYPRDMAHDSRLVEQGGCDVIFAPTIKEMYPEDFKTYVEVCDITDKLCGAFRLGH